MTVLQNPETGSIIQATGRLETRLIAQGWIATDQPPAPGLRIVTAAELDSLATTVTTAVSASQADRTDLRQILEPIATWRTAAQAALANLVSTVAAIDVPSAVNAWLTANPPPAGAEGKSAYQLARDAGYGGTQTQWLATLVGPQGVKGDTGNTGPPGTTDYTALTNKPTLGTAASKDTGTGATQVILGNDSRLTDARTPTAHNQAASTITGLHAVATSGDYAALSNKPALSFDPAGSAATAQAAAVQRANHTGTQAAATITGLHAVATSGDYTALSNKPTIPAALERKAIANTGALTANTVKTITVTWSPALPDTNYAVGALIENAVPQNFAIGVNPSSKTTTSCTLSVRSTAAVNASGVNVHCIAIG